MTTWKPGDVAMVTALNRKTPYRAYLDEDIWREYDDPRSGLMSPATIRPLVVIDPESAEDVKRFDDLLTRFVEGDEMPPYAGTFGCTQAALREFAAPTPPTCDDEFRAGGSRGIHCELAHDHTEWHRSNTNEVSWS